MRPIVNTPRRSWWEQVDPEPDPPRVDCCPPGRPIADHEPLGPEARAAQDADQVRRAAEHLLRDYHVAVSPERVAELAALPDHAARVRRVREWRGELDAELTANRRQTCAATPLA